GPDEPEPLHVARVDLAQPAEARLGIVETVAWPVAALAGVLDDRGVVDRVRRGADVIGRARIRRPRLRRCGCRENKRAQQHQRGADASADDRTGTEAALRAHRRLLRRAAGSVAERKGDASGTPRTGASLFRARMRAV